MEIVVLDAYTTNPGDVSWAPLEAMGKVTIYDRTPLEKIVARIGQAAIVFTNKTPITKETMLACPQLKYIGVLATGVNVVDVPQAERLGIQVNNVPDYSTDAVAQFTFALLLELCHHVGDHDQSVKQGMWTKSPDFCYWRSPLVELSQKTLGIVGYGKIGRRVAEIGRAFGMKILAYNRTPREGTVDLETLWHQSDVISLHCPLTEENQHLIDKKAIEQMKAGVFLINTARGGLIDEDALAKALAEGKVAGAAVDVVSKEPMAEDNPLLGAKNCIVTPHIAWAPKEARQRLIHIASERLGAFLRENPTLKG